MKILHLANELVDTYDMYIAYAVRKQTPSNYKDYFDKRIHMIEVKNFARAINAIMFTPKPQEYTDPLTGEMKKKQMKFFPDTYKNRIGKSYNDYIADHQMNMFEDFIGYQGSAVLDESEREADTTSVPMPRGEEFENMRRYEGEPAYRLLLQSVYRLVVVQRRN